jgi:DNA ligase 1
VKLEVLADAFTRLSESRSRLRAVGVVADLLGRLDSAERESVVYLLQGQLRPAYEGVDFGLAERLLVRVLARAYRATEAAVARRFRSKGDLGLVAESLSGTTPRKRLTIGEAYRTLLEVARAAGAGAVERKVRLLTDLLERSSPVEARYLVRIVQGRLRLGVGDATILEAAAAGALGDRGRKGLLEQAYNVRSDLGGVVALAYARGAAGLARIAPRVGVPVRPALAQRLASAEAIIARLGTVQAEPKYDGFRLQLHRDGERTWAFSRRLENVSEMFPELTDGLRRQLRLRRAILEGEAVVQDPRTGRFLPFQVTMTRKRKHGVSEAAERHPLRFFGFDLLCEGRRNGLTRPQRERSRRLRELIRSTPGSPLQVTESRLIESGPELQRYFEVMIRRGLEGVVAKRPDAPYRAGARGFDWVKLKRSYQSKLRDTVDVVLVGYLAGRGKRAALGVGSLLAAVYDPRKDRFRTVAKIGSGPSELEWKTLRSRMDALAAPTRPRRVDSRITPDVWVEPRLVVEVLADEITRSPLHTCGKAGEGPGYALRFPRMLGVRSDKAPEDATTEREVVEMYRLQGRRARAGQARVTAAGSPSGRFSTTSV